MWYSFQNAKQRKKKEKENILQDKFNNTKERFESDPTDENASDFNTAKEKLELFYEQELEGIIIRARARGRVWTRWKEYEIFSQFGEKETSKKHLKKFWKLKINGSINTNPFKILCEEKHFYQELYTSKNLGNKQATETFLNSLNIPSLTDEQKFSCEESITEEKCVKALQSFQGNKVPGNRGLSIEFYSIWWAIISDPFVNCVNECFTNGEMSLSQKQATITLIEKKGKDRSLLDQFHLSTLMPRLSLKKS